jgi:hypothetical protein
MKLEAATPPRQMKKVIPNLDIDAAAIHRN